MNAKRQVSHRRHEWPDVHLGLTHDPNFGSIPYVAPQEAKRLNLQAGAILRA